VIGLSWTLVIAALLLVSGQVGLALNIAVFALVLLYLIHSVALLLLPRANPELFRSVGVRIPRGLQVFAAWFSILTMSALVLVQVVQDIAVLRRSGPGRARQAPRAHDTRAVARLGAARCGALRARAQAPY
jgi:hypothetical protein